MRKVNNKGSLYSLFAPISKLFRSRKFFQSSCSVVCNFSLLLNIFLPYLAAIPAYAQEAEPTPTEIVEPTTTPEPTSEPSITETPIFEPTATPIITLEPIVEPTIEPTATPTEDPSITPITTDTPAENNNQTSDNNSSDNSSISSAPAETPTVIPSPSTTPTPVFMAVTGEIETIIVPNNTSRTDLLNPILGTDKPDYHPAEIAIISGSGFAANTDYLLVVTAEGQASQTYNIVSDSTGNFTYSYQLFDTYIPNYKVELTTLAGLILATTTFTDTDTTTPNWNCTSDAQGANDEPGQKDMTLMCRDTGEINPLFITWNWDEISLSGKNTGDGCALFDTNSNGKADYSICTSWEKTQNQVDGTRLYLCNDTRPDRCSANLQTISHGSICTISDIDTDPFTSGESSPRDTQATCEIYLDDVGGASSANLLDVCSYPSQQPNSDPSDCIITPTDKNVGNIEVIKILIPSEDDGKFNLQIDGTTAGSGAQVGNGGTTGLIEKTAGDHTIGESVETGTSLSDYSTVINCINSSGASQGTISSSGPLTVSLEKNEVITCTITNTRINNGSITIIKDAVPNDAQDFSFTATGSGLSDFDLDDDSDNTLPNTKTFNDLAAGIYSVVEDAITGWTQTSATCSDGSPVNAIDLSAGENVTCTFTNTKDATLTLIKTVINDNGGTATISDFQAKIDGNNVDWDVVQVVSATTHTVSETSLSGYSASVWGDDCATDGSVSLSPGENKTCTITNDDNIPSLTLIKTVSNENGGTAVATDWTLTATGPTTISGNGSVSSDSTFKAGTYTLTESGPSSYSAGNWICVGGTQDGNEITVDLGQSATCTIINDDNEPSLILNKIVINDNGGTASESDWTLTANGGSAGILTGLGDAGNTDVVSGSSFKAGTYILSEQGSVGGYSTSGWACVKNENAPISTDSIELSLGDVATCTITNDDIAPKLTLVKTVVNDNGGDKVISSFPLFIDGTAATSGTSYDVQANKEITVSETTQTGYTPSDWGGDCAADGTITLLPGDNKTCTITNDDVAPTLTLIKTVITDNGGVKDVSDFPLFINGNLVTSSQPNALLANVEYTATETNLPGYTASDWGEDCSEDGKITLKPGENKTCTITNDDQPGHLIVNKVTDPVGDESIFNVYLNEDFETNLDLTTSNPADFTVDRGTYSATESPEGNWILSGNTCDDVFVDNGETEYCTITNTKTASITIIKDATPNDPQDFSFTGNNDIGNFSLDDDSDETLPNKITFNNLTPDNYSISESAVDGWAQGSINCFGSGNLSELETHLGGTTFSLGAGAAVTCTFNNEKLGTINVTKFNDANGDGIFQDGEENTLNGWTINLTGEDSKVTSGQGLVTFDQLPANTYDLSEEQQDGWSQTAITCDNEEEPEANEVGVCHWNEGADKWNYLGISQDNPGHIGRHDNDYPYTGDENPTKKEGDAWCADNVPQVEASNIFAVSPVFAQMDDSYPVTITAGENVNCYIGNQLSPPSATISKSNDALGNLAPGASVGYKIKVIISGNDVNEFKVTDLLSNGFKYRPGSYNVLKNNINVTGSITEPQYHSPGIWNLGNLSVGDTVELSYIADISSDHQPGIYTDLAYAQGKTTYGTNDPVYAVGENSQYVNENFVGTEVPIVASTQNSISAGIEKHEEGEVLGASTQLPSTGSNNIWLILSTLMALLGFTLLRKSSKKLIAIILFAAFYLFPSNALAVVNPLSVRLKQPISPTNISNLKLTFVALEIDGVNPITVKCFKKGPLDGGFNQMGSNITIQAPGDTDDCVTDSSTMNAEGTYQFYVTANGLESNHVSVDYKTSGPGTPSDYRKDRPSTCDYKIHFKTADDGGKTVKVEIYRADVTSFILDAGSVVASIPVGSNQERDVTNTVPDCNKDYYYVLRAFDDAGNGSGTIGDSVTITSYSTIVTTTTSGAIPVTGVNLPSEEITGEGETPATNEEGQVLGTENLTSTFFAKYWKLLILFLIIVASIVYVALKKRRARY